MIYELTTETIRPLTMTTFGEAGVRERADLQRLLRLRIDVIAPDTLVLAEEFGGWDESRRRIDLLAIDKNANLVVIELKRTEDGGHMELQAVRYAAMVASMTFDQAVEIFERYLDRSASETDARTELLKFLDWDEPDEDHFAQDVRIVLASAEFSKELTTAVMWLNDRDLDITCVRVRPYADGLRTFLDVQQVIPLPEVADYQIRIREKARKERGIRVSNRDTTKFDLTIGDDTKRRLAKRTTVLKLIQALCARGATPEQIAKALPWRGDRLMPSVAGDLTGEEFIIAITSDWKAVGKNFRVKNCYCEDDELVHAGGRTYAVWKIGSSAPRVIDDLLRAFPNLGITSTITPGTVRDS